MDIITDLTAQAVSYIIVYQDLCKTELAKDENFSPDTLIWDQQWLARVSEGAVFDIEKIAPRIRDISWTGCSLSDDAVVSHFNKVAVMLAEWLGEQSQFSDQQSIFSKERPDFNATPYFLRAMFRALLYADPANRRILARILEYLPLQVIYALGGNNTSAYHQRLYRVWGTGYEQLSEGEQKAWETWWAKDTSVIDLKTRGTIKQPRRAAAELLLENDAWLREQLLLNKVALPFESLFNEELTEVAASRNVRWKDYKELPMWGFKPPYAVAAETADPLVRAADMQLGALALSGGGIRSATFNLGLLQRLADLGVLDRFDYISTVSGGGYIGSWFISWIKRAGSVRKVASRMDPNKSADPLAEEVRPVRWLRMFSNYLAPNASIMSADAWTMGITWLRNTVINQVILLLLLCTALSGITAVFRLWLYLQRLPNHFGSWRVFRDSLIILLGGAIGAGLGMRVYDRRKAPLTKYKYRVTDDVSLFLILWGSVAAYLTSSWLYTGLVAADSFTGKLAILKPAIYAGLISMLSVAVIGRYYLCADGIKKRIIVWTWVLISSVAGSFAGWFLLAGVWQFFQYLTCLSYTYIDLYQEKLVFITGVPVVLETISICVVIRMVLMGKLFPDERREWWGRAGAIVHRFMLCWLLVSFSALLVPDLFRENYAKVIGKLPVLLGGWAAIVGFAVKLAYQPKTSGDKASQGAFNIVEIFIRVAPYIFMIGFLLIGAYTLGYYMDLVDTIPYFESHVTLGPAVVTAALALVTLFLSWRTGVNEFSLHHFYRNRLTRAYLGATRRRTIREVTANSFTGFDRLDDLAMTDFLVTNDYGGPYPLLNTALNATVVSELDRQDRKAESFIFSPLYCGFDFSPTRSASYSRNGVFEYGYRPTGQYSQENGPLLGSAMAVSGAALNPNMGYHSSPATAFLLTMFNVRLGRWIGNPRLSRWRRSDPVAGIGYLVQDLIGKSDINNNYICLSDGGHFDNMGLYELIRRRCKYILLGDAEEDEQSTCDGLANAVRRCRIDFGAEIKIDTSPITNKSKTTGFGKSHVVRGDIWYPGDVAPSGTLIYVKAGLTGNESVDIRQYFMANKEFPQQSTNDQFFDEAQFESYRKLGYHSISSLAQLA